MPRPTDAARLRSICATPLDWTGQVHQVLAARWENLHAGPSHRAARPTLSLAEAPGCCHDREAPAPVSCSKPAKLAGCSPR